MKSKKSFWYGTVYLILFYTLSVILWSGSISTDDQIIINTDDPLIYVYSSIAQVTKRSFLIESNFNFHIDINDISWLKPGKHKVDDILSETGAKLKGHYIEINDRFIFLKDEDFISDENYSLNKPFIAPDHVNSIEDFKSDQAPVFHWTIPEDQITDEMRKEVEEESKKYRSQATRERENLLAFFRFRIALEKQRFYFMGMPEEWMLGIEKYNGKTVREVIVDIISKHKLCCWIHEIKGEEKDRLLKGYKQAVKDLKDANMEKYIDEGMLELLKPGPIYGIEIYSPNYNPENFDEEKEEASAKPEQESLLLSDVPVSLDGKKLLKVNSVFSEKKNSLTVTIENISAEKLSFRDLKDDFMIMELYDDERKDTFERTIFASEKTELPASFRLAPGESKIFEFKFNGARFKEKYGHPFLIKEAGTENQLRLDKVPFKELRDLGVRIETFYPIIYFELNGKRYKSSGEEAVMQE